MDWPRVAGRLVEVSQQGFSGALSALVPLFLQVQKRGDPIVWVEAGNTVFFPPDLAFCGIDIGAVSVVLVPEVRSGFLAADWVLRSGAFGLVVLDGFGPFADEAVLARMARMAEEHETAVVFLTQKAEGDPSLGSMISLRGAVVKGPGDRSEIRGRRDRRAAVPPVQGLVLDGPSGLY